MSRFIRIVVLGGLCVLLSAATATAVTAADTRTTAAERAQVAALRQGIDFWRRSTWRWQDSSLATRSRTSYSERREHSLNYLRWVANLWQKRSAQARHRAQHPPHLADWLCIHSAIKGGRWSTDLRYLGGGYHVSGHGEGSWTANGPIYDGGLQMDSTFQRTYGSRLLAKRGPAYGWTPYEQMWVAERAYASGRGFGPWPTTARACGLLGR